MYQEFLKTYLKNRLLGQKIPIHVSFQVTTACNLECAYCYADAKRPRENELNTQEAKKLLGDVKKWGHLL
jgi:MoaA/NifB/PqqE/SkfB family radical SAM enzyme